MAGARYIGLQGPGHLELPKFLSKQGADMNKRDRPDAWQPLHVGALNLGIFILFVFSSKHANVILEVELEIE